MEQLFQRELMLSVSLTVPSLSTSWGSYIIYFQGKKKKKKATNKSPQKFGKERNEPSKTVKVKVLVIL